MFTCQCSEDYRCHWCKMVDDLNEADEELRSGIPFVDVAAKRGIAVEEIKTPYGTLRVIKHEMLKG